MATSKTDMTESPPMVALRRFAMRFPEAEEGTSCVNRAFRARKKTYAYIGMKKERYSVMVKLSDSLAAAEKLQAKRPDSYSIGLHGWTTIRLPHDEFSPPGLLEGWIEESYRLLVHKALVEQLPAGGLAGKAAKKRPARKLAKKKPVAKRTATAKRRPSK